MESKWHVSKWSGSEIVAAATCEVVGNALVFYDEHRRIVKAFESKNWSEIVLLPSAPEQSS